MKLVSSIPPLDGRRLSQGLLLCAVCSMMFSIAAGQTFLVLCALSWLTMLARARSRPAIPAVAWGGLAFLAIAVLSLAIQPSLPRGWGRMSRLGWVLIVPLGAALVSSGGVRLAVLKAMMFGSLIVSLHTLVWHPVLALRDLEAKEPWATDFWHALIHVGSMTDGQMLMLGLLATLGVIWVARAKGERTAVWWVVLGLNGLAFVINYKRGSWLCGLMGLTGFLLLQRSWRSLIVLLLAVAAVLAVPSVRLRLGQIRDEVQGHNAGRMTMWTQVTPGIIRDHPWGVGYGQMNNEKMRQYARRVEKGRSHLHSNIAQVLVETGWVGLAVYLGWMALALGTAIRRVGQHRDAEPAERVPAAVFMLMILILLMHGAVEYNFGDSELLILLCLLMGSASALPGGPVSPPERPLSGVPGLASGVM